MRAHDLSVWDSWWVASSSLPRRDLLSEILLEELENLAGPVRDLRVLETGSGSGRISLKLAEKGAQVCLLDRSTEALSLSRRFSEKLDPWLVRADIDRLPFMEGVFDVVWNSGVMEHWTQAEQHNALRGMARIAAEGSLAIAFNPFAGSFLYRLGKAVLERCGAWPYGHEEPVRTLSRVCPPEYRLEAEYSIAFLAIPCNAFRLAPRLRRLDRLVQSAAIRLLDHRVAGGVLRRADRLLSRLFGGYLLVSAFRRVG